jgi:CRISPR-associated endonuclease/helicase Cas3
MIDFEEAFKVLTGTKGPFPWQTSLYEDWFVKGEFPHSCNLPTGLGKTAVIAIWLIALMNHPDKMPRRLVYVVNRRTVVDQTTEEVEKLRENQPILKNIPAHVQHLAISTLRGQFADNREWSADPSRPAVICGTVDMIGSRLLFNGYGVGFKSKPLHAGFLGQDVLLVHDEAHLEPAFQTLLVAIEKEQELEAKRSGQKLPWPQLRVMELTATSRGDDVDGRKEKPFELTDGEKNAPDIIPDPPTEPIHHVWRRQKAKKALECHEIEDESQLAEKIVRLAKDREGAVLAFVRKIEDVEKIVKKLPKGSTEPLTGTLRGLERDGLVKKPIFQRFLPKSNRNKDVTPAPETVYLVCTSAGEVGVNISADHLVCDLSTFESMTQRFGRVNRFGDRDDTRIDVVYPKEFGKKDKSGTLKIEELDRRRQKTLELLKRLNGDASPAALGKLAPAACRDAFAPPPAILPATDILFDVWALTTIAPPLVRTPLPVRPPVEPYLHGISDWQPPETYVAWRKEVWELRREFVDDEDLKQFQSFAAELLDDYPLKPHELLRDSTFRNNSGIRDKLLELAEKYGRLPVWIQETSGSVIATSLSNMADLPLVGRTVILPPEAGGLKFDDKGSAGLFDGSDYVPEHRDLYDVADRWGDDKRPLRKRVWQDEGAPDGMTLEREIRFENPEDEGEEPIKVWRWFVRKPEVADERSRVAYPLAPHLDEVKDCAAKIAESLGLRNDLWNDLANAVTFAAWCHDLGKHRERWQRSIGNGSYPEQVFAKSGRLPDGTVLRPRGFLKDYRHEFGSVLDVLDERHSHHSEFMKLSHDMQELVLHLIAAHHGRARPHFPMDEAIDLERDHQATVAIAIETPRRFARLQRKYGRWGLAYLESLVRAADYAVSAGLGETAKKSTETREKS